MLSQSQKDAIEVKLLSLGLPSDLARVSDRDVRDAQRRVSKADYNASPAYLRQTSPEPRSASGPSKSPHPSNSHVQGGGNGSCKVSSRAPSDGVPRYMSDRPCNRHALKLSEEKANQQREAEKAEMAAHTEVLERRQAAYERAHSKRRRELEALKPALAKSSSSYAQVYSARHALFNVAPTPTGRRQSTTSDGSEITRPRFGFNEASPTEWKAHEHTGVSRRKGSMNL